MQKFIKTHYQLFTTSLLQVSFVSANVIFISRGYIIPMLITGFLISFVWTLNIKKVAFGTYIDRIIYSLGACVGTGLGYYLSHLLIK